ncbi:MAG: DUF58 domain-containing protein [Thermoanaerobaculia bacterium]|nr:DUF58 domain-containing protein [Thermoanaerobaculia bacterium]
MRVVLAIPRPWKRLTRWLPPGIRRSVGRAATLVRDGVPPTLGGWLVAALCAAALWRWGFGALDLVIFVFGVAGLVLFTLSTLVICLAALWLRRRSRTARRKLGTLESGTPLETGFDLPALARVPLVKVGWQWLHPEGVECRQVLDDDGALQEVAVARRRCRVQTVTRRFTVRCAFGLSRVSWHSAETADLTILPEVGRLGSMEVLQSISSAEGLPHPSGRPEGDRMEIRRYVPGDSVRHILWKTYARTRTLNVRVPERSVDRSERTLAYLLTGRGDEPAAAAARVALERGLLGESWLFGCDGAPMATDRLGDAMLNIAASGSLPSSREDEDPSAELCRFLESPEAMGERHVVIFAPALPSAGSDAGRLPAWTAPTLAALGHLGRTADFVLGTDGVRRRGPVPIWQRLLWADASDGDAVSSDDLDHLLHHLGRHGYGALLVDRSSGHSHGGTRRRMAS